MKKILALLLSFVMIFTLVACGSQTPEETGESANTTEASEAEATTEETGDGEFDFTKPDIVIEFGDADAIDDLATKNQTSEIPEGTVVKITGLYEELGSPGIHERVDDTTTTGLAMNVIGDFEAPVDDTKVEVVGVLVQGQDYMEFHVPAENIKILKEVDE